MKSLYNLPVLFLLCTAGALGSKLTETVFYQADPLVYTAEFCSKVEAKDFLEAIKPDTSKEADKPKAFKTLFEACRGRFLQDATMAKHLIIPMVDTENTEHIPLLLDRSTKSGDKLVLNNLEMDSEIIKIANHLFTLNLKPSADNRYFFQVRNPDRALAHILAYTQVSKEKMEELREFLETIRNHPEPGEFIDAKSIGKAVKIVDDYLESPETVGNHQSKADQITFKSRTTKSKSSKSGGGWLMVVGVVLGMTAVLAVILGLLWKFKFSHKSADDATK